MSSILLYVSPVSRSISLLNVLIWSFDASGLMLANRRLNSVYLPLASTLVNDNTIVMWFILLIF